MTDPIETIRTLQGARIDDVIRDWPEWTQEEKQGFAQKLALLTIQRILPIILRAGGLGDRAEACEKAETLDQAYAAAYTAVGAAHSVYAAAYAAADAAWVAYNAAYTAADAAYAARAATDAARAARATALAADAADAEDRTKVLNLFAECVVEASS